MRSLAAFLLLCMLPGLLLPMGFVMRICRCAEDSLSQLREVRGCCAKNHTPGPALGSICCQSFGREHNLFGPDGGSKSVIVAACKCDWVVVKDHRLDQMPPLVQLLVGLSHPPIEAVIVLPLEGLGYLSHWPAAHNRPPPPDRARNLPLLL